MKAARFHGDRPALTVEAMPDPVPLPGSAVVEVLAAFVTASLAGYIDKPGGRMLPPMPFVPGMDTIGRVVAVADDVSGLVPGDLVYCDHWYASHNIPAAPDHCFLGYFGMGPGSRVHLERWRDGAYAEQMMLPAECMTPLGAAAERASPAQLCRLGWFGTAYGALVKARLRPARSRVRPLTGNCRNGRIAQLVEQLTLNQRVLGSSPSGRTILKGRGTMSRPFFIPVFANPSPSNRHSFLSRH